MEKQSAYIEPSSNSRQRRSRQLPDFKTTSPLCQTIAEDDFPDDLLVHDPSNIIGRGTEAPIPYSRVYPIFSRDLSGFPHGKRGRTKKHFANPARNVAHLHLGSAVQLDSSTHATVFRAPIVLQNCHNKDLVASTVVKLASGVCGAHQRLVEEAKLFDRASASPDVPRFYGFYLPVRKDGSTLLRAHGDECDESCSREVLWTTPILLLEETEDTVVAD